MSLPVEAENAKKLGNEAAKAEKYFEALLHYSHAIKLAPKNAALYSNRALMLLKVQQYYNAMEDALMAIKLMPTWEKGYFRLGEIQFAAEHYQDALWSYKQALQISKDDSKLQECVNVTMKKMSEQRKVDSQYALYGVGIGFLAAVVIIMANETIPQKSAIESDILKVLLVIVISALGYGIGIGYRYIVLRQRASLLEPPIDLMGDDSGSGASAAAPDNATSQAASSSSAAKPRNRRSQASARQKMKTGKS